MKVKRWKS